MKKSNIGAIIRKEFNRFFTDRRLVMTAIILPGLMIYLLYSFMGSAMSNMYSVEDDFAPTAYVVNAPDSIAALAQEAGIALADVSPEEAGEVRAQIEEKQAGLLAVFPADFDAQVASYAPGAGEAPNIELYYNSTDADSAEAYAMFTAMLDGYESSLSSHTRPEAFRPGTSWKGWCRSSSSPASCRLPPLPDATIPCPAADPS